MNDTSTEPQKTVAIKTLAIIGFIVTLVFVAWLAVQAVRLVPAAFKTLASIADGLKNDAEFDFTIATDTDIINTGETLNISWTPSPENGEYVFLYQCTDGVVAEMRDSAGGLSLIPCNVKTPLAQDKNSVTVIFSSEKKHFVDVPYTIGFESGEGEPAYERGGFVTVVNPLISADDRAANDTDTAATTTADTMLNTNTDEAPETPATERPASRTPPVRYRTVPVVVTTLPASNPNGYADLAVTFIGVGAYDARSKTFTPKSTLDEDERGAFRFEVKNIGTKTSGAWYFSANLLTDPVFTYSSPESAALKPNERQVVTLEFDATSKDGTLRATVAVTGGDDTRTANNSFSRQISISN